MSEPINAGDLFVVVRTCCPTQAAVHIGRIKVAQAVLPAAETLCQACGHHDLQHLQCTLDALAPFLRSATGRTRLLDAIEQIAANLVVRDPAAANDLRAIVKAIRSERE